MTSGRLRLPTSMIVDVGVVVSAAQIAVFERTKRIPRTKEDEALSLCSVRRDIVPFSRQIRPSPATGPDYPPTLPTARVGDYGY